MKVLKGFERRYLRSLAHGLKPVVLVGKGGLTRGLLASIDGALKSHELIKVKFGEFKDQKRALSDEIAQKTGSCGVGIVGNVAVFYREHPDAEKRKIRLPSD